MMEYINKKLKSDLLIFLISVFFFSIGVCYASNIEKYPRIDKKTIKEMIKKAQPLIENITGREFKKKIRYKIVKRDEVRDALIRGTLPIYKKIMIDESNDDIARQVENISMAGSQFSLGLYVPCEKKFMVVPDNVEYTVKNFGIEEKDFYDVVFLIVAHEMVHALDDQYFGLQHIHESAENTEALMAFASLREGHAVYVTNTIAKQLKLTDTAEEISVKSAAGVIDAGNRLQAEMFHSTYVKGAQFVDAIVKKNGRDGVSKSFKSPPVSTWQILNPDAYLTKSIIVGLDCLKMIEKIKNTLPIAGMKTKTDLIGASGLRASLIANGISEKEADTVVNNCMSSATFTAIKKTLKKKLLTITAMNFKNTESAEQFLEISERLDASERQQVNAMLNSSYTVVKEATLELDGFDSVRYRHIENTTNGVVTTTIGAEGIMDNLYIGITFINMGKKITEEKILEIMTAFGKERLKMI